ncbi:hypothetical protein [Streptomyces pinistramenti]|uniref:hypothetical protein n=1 Tax=Streptomyces pinistramenti TaxID=2884812 RepID=UPI001D06EBD6|nr:hypothetical protein [Streptomyces pinistramenti]MCB5910361.1 hypothetical protein [Streptomyces pinistramenti]
MNDLELLWEIARLRADLDRLIPERLRAAGRSQPVPAPAGRRGPWGKAPESIARGLRRLQLAQPVTDGRLAEQRHLLDADADTCMPLPGVQALRHDRRAVEEDGTVHAARYAGDLWSFTTACQVYPAPAAVRIEATPDRAVTCRGCRAATDGRKVASEAAKAAEAGVPLTAREFFAVTDFSRPYIPELDDAPDEDPQD